MSKDHPIIDDPFLGVIASATVIGVVWSFCYAAFWLWKHAGAWIARYL